VRAETGATYGGAEVSGTGGTPALTEPHLDPPATGFQASFLAALAEYHAEGRRAELPAERLADPDEFARYVAALRSDVEMPGESARYVAALTGRAPEWPDGYVPQSTYWWVVGDEYLGRLAMRHRLTPHLRLEGGHIGCEVRPSARRQGHATAMLAAALRIAAALGIDPAHMDCEASNLASRRVIERNGGLLEREECGSLYFLVPTR
jgi:predicted acetyltransferase